MRHSCCLPAPEHTRAARCVVIVDDIHQGAVNMLPHARYGKGALGYWRGANCLLTLLSMVRCEHCTLGSLIVRAVCRRHWLHRHKVWDLSGD